MSDAVYEPAYEPYEGSRTSHAGRVATIARRSIGQALASTWFWVLLGLSLLHVAVLSAFLYTAGQVPAGRAPTEAGGQLLFTAEFLADALGAQARWAVTFVLAAVGAGVIAEDLQAGGLTFYFTKPLTKPGYVAGKLAGPFAACLAVTALPLGIVWLLGVAFTPDMLYPDQVWMLPFTLLAASLVIATMTTLVVAGLSALVGDQGWAAGVWIALVLVLAAASRVADIALLDPYNAIDAITQWIIGGDPGETSVWGAGLTVAGWALAGLGGLAWGLHREEVAG